jgi:hypothetical protein
LTIETTWALTIELASDTAIKAAAAFPRCMFRPPVSVPSESPEVYAHFGQAGGRTTGTRTFGGGWR